MSLMLHKGAEACDYGRLRLVDTPPATESHIPLPHHALVDMTKYALGYFGHEIVEEHHAVSEDGMRYFGLLTLRSDVGGYTDTLGLRNSNDKSFPIGIAFGSRVIVCDNLAFIGDHVIKRKHTANSKRDLPGLVAGIIEPLREQRQAQQITFDRYKATEIPDQLADATVMQMFRRGVLNVTAIPQVLRQWDDPEYDWGDKTAWRLFNAATFALTGRVAENPRATKQLHRIIDGACEHVH